MLLTSTDNGATVKPPSLRSPPRRSKNSFQGTLMSYPRFAAVAVRMVQRVPTIVWAVWILGVIITTGVMAFEGGPLN